MRITLPSDVKKILDRFGQNGFQSYLVGGCLRDMLIGRSAGDYDIATDALPSETKVLFHGAEIKSDGEKYGALKIKADGVWYEITTCRRESGYTDGRRPGSVEFLNDIRQDLVRRDFTMNALAYNEKDGLIDLFGGVNDISKKIIRCVGDPLTRFSEDALRILRAFRFSAQLGFTIEKKTLSAMRACAQSVVDLPPAHLRSELNKSVMGAYFSDPALRYPFVLTAFIPEIAASIGFDQHTPYHNLDVWAHTVKSIEHTPEALDLKLCMLLHDIGKPACFTRDDKGVGPAKGHAQTSADMAADILKRLEYPAKTAEHVTQLIRCHDRREKPTYENARAFLYKYGKTFTRELLTIRRADNMAKNPPHSAQLLRELDRFERLTEEVIRSGDYITRGQLAFSGGD
jgi:tRNA nucleotidyltransferase (CCA-adding enzyme)